MVLSVWDPHGSIMGSPYEIVSIGPIYIPYWAYMGLLSGPYMGPLWVCSYDLVRMEPIGVLYELGFWAPYGSFMDVPIWACLFGTDMGLLWAYPYEQARIHPTLSIMESPYGIVRM